MLASAQTSQTSIHRDAWLEINLSALENNVRVVRNWLSPQTQLMAVVKSDAYGHGAIATAPVIAAAGANWFGVASVDEGCQLRAAGVKEPILILSPCPFWAVTTALEADLDLTVTSQSELKDIVAATTKVRKPANIHLKVDTGMHRLGISPAGLNELMSSIYMDKQLHLRGVFSHLAKAEEESTTRFQNNCFKEILAQLKQLGRGPDLIHLASGESARRFPDTHYDLARVGLYLYGLEPDRISDVVQPVLSLRGRINHLQEIDAGVAVGYGHTWISKRTTKLASLPIGYADGVDRGLSNKMDGLLMGTRVKQVGRISMDQMIFDITDVPQAQIGDVITLIGNTDAAQIGMQNPAERLYLASWAGMLDTITYELVCRLRVRLPRIYTRSKI